MQACCYFCCCFLFNYWRFLLQRASGGMMMESEDDERFWILVAGLCLWGTCHPTQQWREGVFLFCSIYELSWEVSIYTPPLFWLHLPFGTNHYFTTFFSSMSHNMIDSWSHDPTQKYVIHAYFHINFNPLKLILIVVISLFSPSSSSPFQPLLNWATSQSPHPSLTFTHLTQKSNISSPPPPPSLVIFSLIWYQHYI